MSAKALGREQSRRTAAAKAVGLSTTARWEGCTKSTASARIRHILRDVEELNGLYRKHSNELIDPEMTSANFSFRLAVAEDGSLVKERITDVDSVFEHLNGSLARVQRYRTVPEHRMVTETDENGNKIPEVDDAGEPVLDKKGQPVYRRRKVPMPNAGKKVPVAMSKDTVVAVEELFQLDPEWTGPIKGMTAGKRAEVQELYDVWYADLVDQYGAQNVLCVSEHWDETNPHVSAFCMPLAERADGTADLNVKLFTTGKKELTRTEARGAYTAKHDRLRAALREHGYEATFERITPRDAQGFAAKGVPLANFKRAAKRATAEERAALAQRETVLDEVAAELERDTSELDQREVAWVEEAAAIRLALDDRVAEIDAASVARTAELDQREASLAEREAEIPQLRAAAVAEGREQGRADGRAEVTQELEAAQQARIAAAEHERRQREAADEAERLRVDAAEAALVAEDLAAKTLRRDRYEHDRAVSTILDPRLREALEKIPAYEWDTAAGAYARDANGELVSSNALKVGGQLAAAMDERRRVQAKKTQDTAAKIKAGFEGTTMDEARRRIEAGEGIMAQQDRERKDRGPDLSEGMDR